jgi:hypothetical protein
LRTKTGVASAAVVPPQPVFYLMTESLGGAGAPLLGSKSLTGPFQPPSIILTWSGFSGLFLFRLPQPLCFFFFGAGGGGECGGGGEEKRFFFFLERFLEGHICSSRCKLPEGRYGVDLNLR